jgi:lipopolysaccharide biosynthesis protein
MTNLKSGKNKHLTRDDRLEIMECLDKGMTFKAIARRVKKDPTTISKEVKKHLTIKDNPIRRTKTDGTPIDEQRCQYLLKAPFVCNPCKRRRTQCSYQKQLYVAKNAHAEYKSLLREAREGIPLSRVC